MQFSALFLPTTTFVVIVHLNTSALPWAYSLLALPPSFPTSPSLLGCASDLFVIHNADDQLKTPFSNSTIPWFVRMRAVEWNGQHLRSSALIRADSAVPGLITPRHCKDFRLRAFGTAITPAMREEQLQTNSTFIDS